MEEGMKIIFGKPYHMPSRADGIELVYSYKVVNSQIEDIKDSNTKSLEIKVFVDCHLANKWGFQIWQPSKTYNGLIKIILPDVIYQIKRKYYEGTLNDNSEVIIETSFLSVDEKPNTDKLPEVEGHEEVF